MANSLCIMEWNADGLLRHQHELQVILSTENIYICLISETYFDKESFIRFKNYLTYHAIHPANTAWGRSATVIRNNIKHFEEEKSVTRDIQTTIVTIETSKQRLTISAIYCPPRYNILSHIPRMGGMWLITLRGFRLVTGFIHFGDL
jgi:hypothetical protein